MEKIIVLIVLATFLKNSKPMDIWKDQKKFNFLDYDECVDNEICQNNFEDLIKNKPKEIEDTTYPSNVVVGKKTTKMAPWFDSQTMPCLCGIEFHLLDLGSQYYPRYLHSGVCKSEVCSGTYRCVERHYRVRVLKQKESRNPEIKTSMAFTDNIKGIWQPEFVTVTVACECSI